MAKAKEENLTPGEISSGGKLVRRHNRVNGRFDRISRISR
jgi:hypothetical protein